MIRVLVGLILLGFLAEPLSADSLWSCDKGAHFGVSLIGFQGSALAFRDSNDPELGAAAVILGVGLFKELYDLGIQRESFSVRDLIFDALGVLVGCALIRLNRALGERSFR